MVSSAIYLLCVFALAYGQDTCVTPGGTGPCVGGMCPNPTETCINDDVCCLTTEVNVPTTTVAVPTTTAAGATTQTTTCNNVATNCPALAYLCDNSQYRQLMTEQCGSTCGRCSGTATTSSSTCVDKLNPNTGRSDCPNRTSLCNDSRYFDLMTEQCPKTCGRCSSTGVTTPASTCVDKVNPNTGRSDCASTAYLCQNASYYKLMTEQCPRTCGRC